MAQLIICRPVDNINPLITTSFQVACILVTSHVFQILLKRLGQPAPVAQLLAGIVVGPSLLSRIGIIKSFFLQASSANYYNFFAFVCRIVFMFLIGLETDIPFVRRNWRGIFTLAFAGSILACVFGASMSWFIIILLKIQAGQFGFTLLVMSLLASTGSPIVIRLIEELKFETSNIGRLAIYASLVNEMSCIVLNSVMQSFTSGGKFGVALASAILIVIVIFVNKYLAKWFNKRKYKNKHVSNGQISVIVILVACISFLVDFADFSSILTGFLLGLMFPKNGKTTRTLLGKLNYGVNTFVLPIYFGYTGFQFNVDNIWSASRFGITVLMIVLGTAAKVVATVAACYHLKIPWKEAIMLGFALNLKGNYDILLIDMGLQMDGWWNTEIHNLFLSIIVLNTVILGPVVSFILNNLDKSCSHASLLENLNPESELRISACVYSPRQVSGQLSLISALSGSKKATMVPYLIHLVKMTKSRQSQLMYHQQNDEDQFSDEEDYGGNDELEINDYVDAFTSETKLLVHKIKDVSCFSRIDEDVCNWAKELRTAMIFLPFHKHQRIDGKMELGLEEIRTINQKVIRDAPCSVGIYVDKGQTGFQQPHGSARVQEAAVLFFGGPDDREALACGRSMAAHPQVNITVIRFLSAVSPSGRPGPSINDASQKDEEVIMAISDHGIENQKDEAFLEAFSSSYVHCGKARLVEKYVNDGAETAASLREIGAAFSLLIIGKGGGGYSPLTAGMSDWEECPELGLIGDLLASTDMNINGSILVVQRNRGKDGSLIGG